VRTCYRLVADLLAIWPTSLQEVIVMEFGKRHNTHNGLLPAPTCYRLVNCYLCCGLVTDLLWTYRLVVDFMDLSFILRTCCLLQTCYKETVVMDYWPLLLLGAA